MYSHPLPLSLSLSLSLSHVARKSVIVHDLLYLLQLANDAMKVGPIARVVRPTFLRQRLQLGLCAVHRLRHVRPPALEPDADMRLARRDFGLDGHTSGPRAATKSLPFC